MNKKSGKVKKCSCRQNPSSVFLQLVRLKRLSHITVTAKNQEGDKRQLKQKAVVYWSKHFYDRDAAEYQSFLEFIKS